MASLIGHPNVTPMHGSYEVLGFGGDACIVRPSGDGWGVDLHRPYAGVEQVSEERDLEDGLAAVFRRLGVKQ